MKVFIKIVFISVLITIPTQGQSQFSAQAYATYLSENQNLTYEVLQSKFQPQNPYFKGFTQDPSMGDYAYSDSIQLKYDLSSDEIKILKQNHFVVSERLSFDCFGTAFHDIYVKDLPVFISSDAVLQALHASYDQILIDVEVAILKPNLITFLDDLYTVFDDLNSKYPAILNLQASLEDVDLYVTMAKSLLAGTKLPPHRAIEEKMDVLWEAIQNETLSNLPLFSERDRQLDLSQFTVRGHYNNDDLSNYFKAMMWMGRMDFWLTPPPLNPFELPWTREEIRRMNISAYLLNELIELTGSRNLLDQNNHIISFLVGESDNLTPTELSNIINEHYLNSAEELLNDSTYDAYCTSLRVSGEGEQKILSQYMMMDPYSSQPGELPVAFRLVGQRFIIDSYIFSNLVYDRIVYQDAKIWRPMPDPLDALFVLGNDDALPLLKEELETYNYASQLDALRYLVDSYDDQFWEVSLYNVWLNAIRSLNPSSSATNIPVFMKSAAWHQNKINTQLASWSQLRHDNLLYAKQSYTGATGCIYPYSYIEPVPEFYARIADFAESALEYFNQLDSDHYGLSEVKIYFPKLKAIMNKLEVLAHKELNNQSFSEQEEIWLKEMLFQGGQSGEPPYTGWYSDLYYHGDDAALSNYIIADVHTQPTDQSGEIVGNILHVGTAKINLGIFLIENSHATTPMAFVGPVMSYYQHTTNNFNRLTDEIWTSMVETDELPVRPDWVNIYLADAEGKSYLAGRELASVVYSLKSDGFQETPYTFILNQNYPNPFNPSTQISFVLPQAAAVKLSIYNTLGQKVYERIGDILPAGVNAIRFDGSRLPSGCYYYRVTAGSYKAVRKMLLVK